MSRPLVACLVLALTSNTQAQTPHHHSGPALLGTYEPDREASGTSWQPETGGMEGLHFTLGSWNAMIHGFGTGVFTDIAGPRGGRQFFGTNMLMMGMARPLAGGTIGIRAMASLEPLLGGRGYRLLLQTGESSDGLTHLLDRQHPHDLFMELSASYSRALGSNASAFLYAGWPGEPALGPPAFMHRRSAAPNPLAPLGHHWLDSTHITFGVVTVGAIWKQVKLDASAFKGREPDSARWNLDRPGLDSQSVRLTVNPRKDLSIQASTGWLHSPELLHTSLDERRHTASVSWSVSLPMGRTHVTAAWGRKVRSGDLPNCFGSAGCYGGNIPYPPNRTQDALLLEAAIEVGPRHTVFARAERVEKDQLFPGSDPFHPRVFPIGSVLAGYLWDVKASGPIGLRIGGAFGVGLVPEFIAPDYGGRRVRTVWLVAQTRLR
jgi:hypothetical protein